MRINLGISPCPNDTFMFDALINSKIDTQGIDFHVSYEDVEQLNQWAIEKRLDVTKVSFSAYTHCVEDYVLLNSGSAIGDNCGPLLIKKPEKLLDDSSLIAIPGRFTTANMLFSYAYPNYHNKATILFSDIEQKVESEEVDAGVIIHENRFTYMKRGLEKVKDLGKFWQEKTNLLIPLGGIIIKRCLSLKVKKTIDRLIRESITFAFNNPSSSLDYIQSLSQEIDKDVLQSHIDLYVNKNSLSLNNKSKESIRKLFIMQNNKFKDIFVE